MALSPLPQPQVPSETETTGPVGAPNLLQLIDGAVENGGSCCGGSCSIG